MIRHTFLLYVYADAACTLENLSTRERIRVPDLAAVGPQIERCLTGLTGPEESLDRPATATRSESKRGSAR